MAYVAIPLLLSSSLGPCDESFERLKVKQPMQRPMINVSATLVVADFAVGGNKVSPALADSANLPYLIIEG